jgi:histone-lysine N-methyltransferase SETD3
VSVASRGDRVPPPPAAGGQEAVFRRLAEWLEAGGGRCASLCLRAYGDGERGAHARVPIRAGEVFLVVPRRLILSEEVARASGAGRRVEAAGTELRSGHSLLAACLLELARDADPFWAPFVASLPAAFPHVPLFYAREELALLEGSLLVARIEERRSLLAADHADLCRCDPGFARFTAEEFAWAHVAVRTRSFGWELYGERSRGLVPMADMLNHRRPRESAWGYDRRAGAFVMTSLRDVAAGEPVHTTYGNKCNSGYLLNYGFCLEENPDNRARVRCGGRSFLVPASLDDERTRRLLACLRSAGEGGGETAPASPTAEARALLSLAAACRESLGGFPTSLEEDEALLADPGLGRNARNAIVMRRGEKRVLHALLGLAEGAAARPRRRLTSPAA